jgi:hypothetical protein
MATFEPTNVDPGNFFARLFYIICYVLILGVVRFILWGVLLVQITLHLFGAEPSLKAQKVGSTVADYVFRIWVYLSYGTNAKPFPFSARREDE